MTNELFTVEAMEKSAEVIVKNFLYLIHLVWKKLKLTRKNILDDFICVKHGIPYHHLGLVYKKKVKGFFIYLVYENFPN